MPIYKKQNQKIVIGIIMLFYLLMTLLALGVFAFLTSILLNQVVSTMGVLKDVIVIMNGLIPLMNVFCKGFIDLCHQVAICLISAFLIIEILKSRFK